MSILPTWPIAAGALVLGLVGGAWLDHTVMASRIAKIEKDGSGQESYFVESDNKSGKDKCKSKFGRYWSFSHSMPKDLGAAC